MSRKRKAAQGDTVARPTGPILADDRAVARYLVQRFGDQQMSTTGALLLDEKGVPLGTLILELRTGVSLSALYTMLAGTTTQIFPFLFKPGLAPKDTDEEVDLFNELAESPLLDVTVPDCVCVWSTGHYATLGTDGRLACVDDPEGREP